MEVRLVSAAKKTTLNDAQIYEMRTIVNVCEMAAAAARSATQKPDHAAVVQWDKVATDLCGAAKSAAYLHRTIKHRKGVA